MLAAIYDAVTGAADPRPFPERSWHLDEFLYAVYCAVAGLDDPGCPAPTCRIEEFWKGIYDAATGDDDASVPDPVWRIEEFLAGIFDVASGWGASVLTETGNAPLTLANAIARAIKSLTQTGLCTQADTPTPSAPVDIKCNNGALRMVDDELPSGYKRLTGIHLESARCVITGFYLTGADTLRFRAKGASSNWIGCFNSSDANDNFSFYATSSSTGKYARYNGQTGGSSIANATTWYDIEMTPNGVTGSRNPSTFTPSTFTCSVPLCIGATSPTGTASSDVSFEGNIEVAGRLVLIPCERESDNALGWHDGTTFYAISDGTATILGYDMSHLALGVVGTPEVLSVGGKNLNGGTIEHIGFTSTGSSSTSDTFAGTGTIIPCVAGEKYTVSFGGFTTSGISGVFVNTWKTDGTFNLRQAISSTGETTFTIPDGVNKVNFTLYKTGGATIDSTSWMQVERGASATPYEPYVEPQTASVVNLLSVGTYADTQDIISGAVTRRIGIKVFDGTEDWTYSGSRFRLSAPDRVISKTGLWCTHFEYSVETSVNMPNDSVAMANSSDTLFFRRDNITSLEGWESYLAAQYAAGTPVIVIYPLAEATTESVEGQHLSTVAGTNTVSVTAEVSPVALTCEYYGASS